MTATNQINGNDQANTLPGTAAADLIYGFDPNGTTGSSSSISAHRVGAGFSQPVFATAAPGDYQHLFVVERTGQIKILDLATGATSVFLDLSSQITTAGEGGVLGLAFDPDYLTNGQFYVDLTNPSDDTEVRRYQVSSGNPLVAAPASKLQIIAVDQPTGRDNHKAGWIGFGPDGDLYVPLGDGGGGGDPDRNGQNPATLLGKLLRLDVHGDDFPGDAGLNYAIPADNPFVGVSGVLPEIWALGLRNPFRDSFDRDTGRMFIADVGQGVSEEIDIGLSGANYGWNVFEGSGTFQAGPLGPGTLTDPIYTYDHSVGRAIIGGYVNRGEGDGLQGQYWLADNVTNKVFTLREQQDGSWVGTERTSQITMDAGSLTLPASFAEDAAGNLYLVDLDGSIYGLTANVMSGDAGDVINALAGNDVVHAGAGDDAVSGGDGNDLLYGGLGADGLNGDAGDDMLFAGEAADILDGGTGNDTLIGGTGNDRIVGGSDVDMAVFGAGSATYTVVSYNDEVAVLTTGSDGRDRLSAVEKLQFSDKTVDVAGLETFDPLQYIASYGDLITAFHTDRAAGYEHFVTTGFGEGRHANFEALEYIASYGDLIASLGASTTAGEQHYIDFGFGEGRHTSFDGLAYIASYGDLVTALGASASAGARHYIEFGLNEGRHATFDGLAYVASYGDLISALGANATAGERHFIQSGFNEGRHTSFDSLNYIASYGDLITGLGVNATAGAQHYIEFGAHEGRHADFNAAAYLSNYPDLQQAVGNDLQAATIHFIQFGFAEGRHD